MSKQSEELYEIIGDSKEKYIEHADNKDNDNKDNDNKSDNINMINNKDLNNCEDNLGNVISFDNKKNNHFVLKICVSIAAILILAFIAGTVVKGKDSYIYKTFFQNKDEEKNNKDKEDIGKSEADVFDKYVENTLSKEIGMAPIDDVDKLTVDFKSSERSVLTTLDGLNGIVSYQKADLDDDGEEELMVFTIDKQDKEITIGQWDRIGADTNVISCSIYENKNGEVTLSCKQPIFQMGYYYDDCVVEDEYVKIELLNDKYIICSSSLGDAVFVDAMESNGVVFEYDGDKINLLYECLDCLSDGMVPKEDNDTPTSENLIKLGVNQEDIVGYRSGYKTLGGKILFTYILDNSENFNIVKNQSENINIVNFSYDEEILKPVVIKMGKDEINLNTR